MFTHPTRASRKPQATGLEVRVGQSWYPVQVVPMQFGHTRAPLYYTNLPSGSMTGWNEIALKRLCESGRIRLTLTAPEVAEA